MRYVGEPVALVIGETEEVAQTAAELLEVDYEVLPSVIDAREGMQPSAPVIWPGCSKNISLMCEVGYPSDTEVAFEKATHIVKFESWVQRITGSPMEPRAAIGLYDRKEERYVLRSASGRLAELTPGGHWTTLADLRASGAPVGSHTHLLEDELAFLIVYETIHRT